jgi:hypothetical protein
VVATRPDRIKAAIAAGMLIWMGMPARNTSAGTRMTPPIPMHPIIKPDVIPRSMIQSSSDIANDVTRPCAKTKSYVALHNEFVVRRTKHTAYRSVDIVKCRLF